MGQLKNQKAKRLAVSEKCLVCNIPTSVDDLDDSVCSNCNHNEQQMLDD